MVRPLLPALAALASWPVMAGELTARDLGAALIGTEIRWWEAEGWRSGTLHLAPDGTAEITLDGPVAERDTGRWRISGNSVCTIWSRLRGGEEACYSLTPGDGGLYVTSGGNVFDLRIAGV